MILMGTGTSHGIPVIGCDCAVCRSEHEKDKRLRCSAFIEDLNCSSATNILIDAGPEFRIQALKYGIKRLDGVLLTHSHADHCHGIDDLRAFSHIKPGETIGAPLPIYANSNTIEDLRFRFSYMFKEVTQGGGVPNLDLIEADSFSGENPLVIGGVRIIPVPMKHGVLDVFGWILKDVKDCSIVYLTDCSSMADSSIDTIKKYGGNIIHAVVDGLRERPHSTHCNFDEALSYADRIGAAHTWLTHFCHDFFHADIQQYIDKNLGKYANLRKIVSFGGSVAPAYDGIVLETAV